MVAANKLEALEDAGRKWITEASVEAHLAEKPKAGRPKGPKRSKQVWATCFEPVSIGL